MDIIKKLFSGDKLSTYEREQKRRYKQYVKLGTTSTIVMSKTESEIYQDYLVRRSLRRSKRKAAAAKLQNKQEDMFKDTDSNPGLSAAPAVLDAINRNVSFANVPNEHLNDLKQMETVTVQTDVSIIHHKEERRHSSMSEQGEIKNRTEVHSKRNTQPLDQKFAYGNQDMFLDQLDEVIRKRNRGHSLENISQIPLYENINNIGEPSPTILAVKPRKKVIQNRVEANRSSEDIKQYTPKEQAQSDEIATVTHLVHSALQPDSSIDYYQSETEEIVWGTPPSNILLPTSRSSSCITTQSEDSFFDCISEDDDIYDDEEKNIMKQISPPLIEHKKRPYHEPETDFRSLGSEDEIDLPPQYETIINKEQLIENQKQNNVPMDIESTNDKVYNSNLLDDFIEPDSLEPVASNENIINSVNSTNRRNSVSPELSVLDKEEKEEENTPNITSWAEKVRMKEGDFVSDEKSKEEVHQQEEVLIHDEALLLDDGFSNSELLNPQVLKTTNKNELIKLENNNDYSDADTDNYRTDSKKVTFDFAKSYCQTYEVENSTEEEEYDESPIHSPIRRYHDKLFEPDHFFTESNYNESRMKRHNLENIVPTDDRSKVFLSYGVQPSPTQQENLIDKSFEISINMDLAFLNCVDGFNSQLVQPKPKNITIVELDEKTNIQNQDLDSKHNTDSSNCTPDETLESEQNQKEFLLSNKGDTDNSIQKSDLDEEVLEPDLLSKSDLNSSLPETEVVLVNKVDPDPTHHLPSNTPHSVRERETHTPLIEVNSEDIITKNNFSDSEIHGEIKESNRDMLLPKISENWESSYSDVIINRNSANILDDSLSTISESGEILKPKKISEEVNQNNLSDDFGYVNDADSLIVEQGDSDYCEAINLVLKDGQIRHEDYSRNIESPVSPVQPLSLEIFTNSKKSETAKDFVRQQLKPSEQSDLKIPLDDKKLGRFSPNPGPTSPKLLLWESDSYIPEYKPVFEVNTTNEQSTKNGNTTNTNDAASTNNPTNSVSYSTLSRSTSAPHVDNNKTKRAMIYSNRNIFTNNARKPIQRSVSQSFGFAYVSPTVNNRYSADYKEPNHIIASKDKININEGSDSLADIQRRLSAVRNIESPEKQLITIQELLIELKTKANLLESKTDDEYVRLLQTLFKCIRIVSGFQCNFDQELLVSQQNTLKEIKDCISDLNAK